MVEKKRKFGCLSKVATAALIFVTLIVSVLAGAFGSTDLSAAASNYEKNRKSAKAAGMFFTDAEVWNHFKVPDAENGMGLLGKIDSKPIGSPDDLTDEEIVARKTAIEAAVKIYAEVSKRKYLLGKTDVIFPSFSDLSKSKFGVKLLCRMAKYSSDRGDLDSCRGYLHSAVHLSNGAADGGSAIPILVRCALAAIVETRLKRMIPEHANDPAWLSMIHDTLIELDQPYDLLTMMKMDHRERMRIAEDLKKEPMTWEQMKSGDTFPLSMRLGYYLPRYKEASHSRVHEYYSELARLLPKDPYDFEQMQKAIDYGRTFSKRKGWSYESLMEPEFDQLPVALWKEISNRNALFQAVAILETHADPAKGLPLKGRYQIDHDGKPIRIKHLEKGWVVYSLYDMDDDGGQEVVKGKGDFVVHLSPSSAPVEPAPRGQKAIGISSGNPLAP